MSAAPRFGRPLRVRVGHLKMILRFAWSRGASLNERVRLFYHAGLKPSLVFRGWATYGRRNVISFRTRVGGGRIFRIHAHDNGMDVGTFCEFFSSRLDTIPPGAPVFQPTVVCDAGAHIGMAALYLAMRYPQARFYGFEPLPINYEVCSLNYRNLPRSRAFPLALGARQETATFLFGEGDLRGGRLEGTPPHDRDQLKQRMEVSVRSIKDLVASGQVEPPDFLKIDVEGAELGVLDGLGELFKGVRRIWVETHGPALEAICLTWLQEHGFKPWHHRADAPGMASIWSDRKC